MDPFQIHESTVLCSTQFQIDGKWVRCNEPVVIQGKQSTWPKCAKGHTTLCPDSHFCWQPSKCITAGRCKGLRACND